MQGRRAQWRLGAARRALWARRAERARGAPLVGSTPEALLSVRPDLVLVDAYTRAETLALLAAAGVPVVRTVDPHGFADIETNLRMLGRVTHLEDEVGAVADAMRAELGQVAKVAEEMPEWRLLSLDGALHTYGEGSLFDAIARAAGATNVAAEHGVESLAICTVSDDIPSGEALTSDERATTFDEMIKVALETVRRAES